MKKIITIAVVVLMIISLIACSNDGIEDLTVSQNNNEKISLEDQLKKSEVIENQHGEFKGYFITSKNFNDKIVEILMDEAVPIQFEYLEELSDNINELKNGDKVVISYIKKVEGEGEWFGHMLTDIQKLEKVEEKNFIDVILEQPNNNTAYWYVINSDTYILRKDISELVEVLSLGTWQNTGQTVNAETSGAIVINFNEFPKGKNEQNFDYNMGTLAINQLAISTETQVVFDGYSTEGEAYLLDTDIINALQLFIDEKAVSHEELVKKMN